MNPSPEGAQLKGAQGNRLMDLHNELAVWGHGRIEKKRKELAILRACYLTETLVD